MKKSQVVGPYTLLSPLGDSKRSRVWLACMGGGGDRVALKLATPGDTAARASLLDEVEIAGALDHPNILRLYECGESRCVMWMAMGYVPGPHAPLKLGNLRQLLLALVHLHALGIVHADIEPGNLLRDEHGDLRLAGFARARRFDAPAAARSAASPFMAPEQVRGEALDLRADVFAAGAVLYQILTGKPPASPPALPSALVQGLGSSFDNVIVKALAPDKADRYASAFAMLSDYDAACGTGVRREPGLRIAAPQA